MARHFVRRSLDWHAHNDPTRHLGEGDGDSRVPVTARPGRKSEGSNPGSHGLIGNPSGWPTGNDAPSFSEVPVYPVNFETHSLLALKAHRLEDVSEEDDFPVALDVVDRKSDRTPRGEEDDAANPTRSEVGQTLLAREDLECGRAAGGTTTGRTINVATQQSVRRRLQCHGNQPESAGAEFSVSLILEVCEVDRADADLRRQLLDALAECQATMADPAAQVTSS